MKRSLIFVEEPLLPYQEAMLKSVYNRDRVFLVNSRATGKTYAMNLVDLIQFIHVFWDLMVNHYHDRPLQETEPYNINP